MINRIIKSVTGWVWLARLKKAKRVSLEIWRYLAAHPEIDCKSNLPKRMWNKIRRFIGYCPLCELLKDTCGNCQCPLGNCLTGSDYEKWASAVMKDERKEAAAHILQKIEAWEPLKTMLPNCTVPNMETCQAFNAGKCMSAYCFSPNGSKKE